MFYVNNEKILIIIFMATLDNNLRSADCVCKFMVEFWLFCDGSCTMVE